MAKTDANKPKVKKSKKPGEPKTVAEAVTLEKEPEYWQLTDDEVLLRSPEPEDEYKTSDSWRVFRIMGEFVGGFDDLATITRGVSIFGSARTAEGTEMYDAARETAKLLAEAGFETITGGGPGIMEADNRGAADVKGKSIGLNISLPHEQRPNPYITPALCFQFRYFALRKMHFLLRAKALVAFPGGFGTCDELFDALTLLQTKKVRGITVILVGREFWRRLINWQLLEDNGFISSRDRKLFHYADTAEEAWKIIARKQQTFRRRPPPPRWFR